MKKTVVTWRLGFLSPVQDSQLAEARALLEPIADVRRADDFAVIDREFGQSDYLFTEPAAERTASELALHCLRQAHRLGRAWSIMWPGVKPLPNGGYLASDVNAALYPESLDGLSGSFNASGPMGRGALPTIETASFSVILAADEKTPPPPIKAPSAPPIEEPIPTELLRPVMSAVLDLLVRFRAFPWHWTRDAAAAQLEQAGYRCTGEGYEGPIFSAANGTTAQLPCDGAQVRAIEFTLAVQTDPHLLDETAYARRQREFEEMFRAANAAARPLLGAPAFSGAAGDPGFPDGVWADWVTLWPAADRNILVLQRQNDRELPLELCLVFVPVPGD